MYLQLTLHRITTQSAADLRLDRDFLDANVKRVDRFVFGMENKRILIEYVDTLYY